MRCTVKASRAWRQASGNGRSVQSGRSCNDRPSRNSPHATPTSATVEPTEEAFEAWNADLQARMGRTVWNTGGCASWYLDDHRRNTTLWPRGTIMFRHLLHEFDAGAYQVTGAPSQIEEMLATVDA